MMYHAYVSRKVELFNRNDLRCAAWHKGKDWIALGGCVGLLKVVKLNQTSETQYNTSHVDLVINHTLDGHCDTVVCLTWNEPFNKLVSSDESGLTIVWGLQEDTWHQEMVHNRKTSLVIDMKWTFDGALICIAYEDGAIVVGSVEGSRIWGLELNVPIRCFAWTPDNRFIILITGDNTITMYDKMGNHIKNEKCESKDGINNINWQFNHTRRDVPPLFMTSVKGHIVSTDVIKNEEETFSINSALLDGISLWNPYGNILVTCGSNLSSERDDVSTLVVQFYDIHQTKILDDITLCHKEKLVTVEWLDSGLKVAVVTEQSIYFLDIRYQYKWATMNSNNTLVYQCIDSKTIFFFNTKRLERYSNSCANVSMVIASGNYCAIISSIPHSFSDRQENYASIIICDEVGNEWSKKEVEICPNHASMNGTSIIVSDHCNVYIDKFGRSDFSSSRFTMGMEQMFHIQNKSSNPSKSKAAYIKVYDVTGPKITAVSSTTSLALFALENNDIMIFSLPNIVRLNKLSLRCNIPRSICINCDASKFSVIDSQNVLQIFDLEEDLTTMIGLKSYLDSSTTHHAWAMQWSTEDSDSIAVFDKGTLFEITLKENVQKAVVFDHCQAYLMNFSYLEIGLVLLDDLILNRNAFSTNCTFRVPTKILEEARLAISQESDLKVLRTMFFHVSKKHLWKVIGNTALQKFDLVSAEKSFALCEDYSGILFIQKISSYGDKNLQKAEVLKFTGNYIEAEKSYSVINRYDLAIQMNVDLGEWIRVKSLLDEGEVEIHIAQKAWSTMADYYFKQNQFQVAAEYYINANNNLKATECFLLCQNIKMLGNIINDLTTKCPHLNVITDWLMSNGLYNLAIICQKKVDTNSALETCIRLKMWTEARSLADDSGLKDYLINIVEEKYQNLLKENQHLGAFQLCHSVELHSDAARILSDALERKNNYAAIPHFATKKIFILGANQVERHRDKTINMSQLNNLHRRKAKGDIASSIEQLLNEDVSNTVRVKNKDDAFKTFWQNAAAQHYFLVAHKHLYNEKLDVAIQAAIKCCEFTDILSPRRVFSLIALTSYLSGYYEVCSYAMTRLRTLSTSDELTDSRLEILESQIFNAHRPVNKFELHPCYIQCLEMGKKYNACTITGKNITNEKATQCRFCHFYMLEEEARGRISCSLCHSDCRTTEIMTILE